MNDYFNEDCIRASRKYSETIVQNICTYEEVRVPWDTIDWFSFFVVILAYLITFLSLIDTICDKNDDL